MYPPPEAVEPPEMVAVEVPTTGTVGPGVTRLVVVKLSSFPYEVPNPFVAYALT
jgi:hypothetical protein